jgi:hypothetical protein
MTVTGGLTKSGLDNEFISVSYRMQAAPASGLTETVTPNGGGWGMTVIAFDTLATSGGGTAPSITTQPQNQTVNVGDTATFTVVASGTGPLSYQWRVDGVNDGTNSSTFQIPNAQIADSGKVISVVVTGATSPPATSSNATLTVVGAPASLTITAPMAAFPSALSLDQGIGSGVQINASMDAFPANIVIAPAPGAIQFGPLGNGSGLVWVRNDITAYVRDRTTRQLIATVPGVSASAAGGTISAPGIVVGGLYRVEFAIPPGGALPNGAKGDADLQGS